MPELWAARPHSMIVRVDVDAGASEVIHEERCWCMHFNASPRLPNIMTFCHEGPWNKVAHRIWGLDLDSGRAWKIRPTGDGECVGHEYWMPDGEHIGYHGHAGGHGPGHALHMVLAALHILGEPIPEDLGPLAPATSVHFAAST